jgi:formylglycine-generating enzyme required for sulfatase activity
LAVGSVACSPHEKDRGREVSASRAEPQAGPIKKRKRRARVKPAALAPPSEAEASKEAELARSEPVCPDDMQIVSGDYCRNVEQKCLEPRAAPGGGSEDQRCARFEAPSRCTNDAREPRKMSFCMDRYEYPNREGELPMTLISWTDAERVCGELGKRLCTESEFNFACEGEKMLPYTYGFSRDKTKCNIDRPYLTPAGRMLPFALCEANPGCKAEFARIDGREKIGSRPECVSPFGIHDMNGNVNEWVSQPWKDPPHRAAIKGGWWGPVRDRCRAITLAHDETYLGYEVGFRCCKDAASSAGSSSQQQ